jgi:N-acetylneuraminate lyase
MENYQRLKGLIAAPFTPMDAAGKVNLPVIDSYAELMIRSGVKGVFICGTSGESASLTTEERKEIAVAWVKAAKGRLKVIVHAGSTSLPQSIDLAQHASETGADAIAAMAPYFFKPATVNELIDFLAPIAGSAGELPFYYYHMPSMTGVHLPVLPLLVEGRKRMPNLVGAKYTHNNLMEMAECIHFDNGVFEILNGYDELLIAGLAYGATAAVGSTYNYLPEVYTGIIEAMEKNDVQTARKLQMQSIKIVEIIIKHGGGVRGGKAIMNLIGIECGCCRLPVASFGEEEYKQLTTDLQQVGYFDNKK